MDRAVDFYTQVLGLRLAARYGNEWASIDAGDGSTLGLHPQSPHGPAPGTSGSISVGLNVTEPLDQVVTRLTAAGVQFRGPIEGDPKASIRLAFFGDPDGNDLYLCESRY
jgi:catechol 2,3-dioxygenase-like lactoylglutathione lyase family enzyme